VKTQRRIAQRGQHGTDVAFALQPRDGDVVRRTDDARRQQARRLAVYTGVACAQSNLVEQLIVRANSAAPCPRASAIGSSIDHGIGHGALSRATSQRTASM
jgi:hypothetical protein